MANQCFDQKQESLEPEQEPSDKNELFHWILTLAIAVIIALCVNRFVLVNAEIPSGSMENTIMTGDRVFGNRLAYIFGEPKRFDIIIFRYPDDEKQLFIKRIIGLPGETVEIHDGQIFIDGSKTPLKDVTTKEFMQGSFGLILYLTTVISSWGITETTQKTPATGNILLLRMMKSSEKLSYGTGLSTKSNSSDQIPLKQISLNRMDFFNQKSIQFFHVFLTDSVIPAPSFLYAVQHLPLFHKAFPPLPVLLAPHNKSDKSFPAFLHP